MHRRYLFFTDFDPDPMPGPRPDRKTPNTRPDRPKPGTAPGHPNARPPGKPGARVSGHGPDRPAPSRPSAKSAGKSVRRGLAPRPLSPVEIAAQRFALQVDGLKAVLAERRPADASIAAFFRLHKGLPEDERGRVVNAVYGVLRHRIRLAALLDQAVGSGVRDEPRWLLIAYLIAVRGQTADRILPVIEHLPPRHVFRERDLASAVGRLRATVGTLADGLPPVEGVAVQTSLPDWFAHALVADGLSLDDIHRFGEAIGQPAPLTLRINPIRAPREAVRGALRRAGVETDPTTLSPWGLVATDSSPSEVFASEPFKSGWVEVQDEGSQLIPLLVDPKPTWRVADACAGGGGKTLALAAIMANRGELVAMDVALNRLQSLKLRARRAGLSAVRTRALSPFDAEVPAELAARFDAVLVDAPCSGTGVWRRNPDGKSRLTPADVAELAVKQRTLLDRFAALVKPGGRLVYATCSVLRAENEDVVLGFLSAHPEFQPADPTPMLTRHGLPDAYARRVVSGALRLWPHLDGTDGFFIQTLDRAK